MDLHGGLNDHVCLPDVKSVGPVCRYTLVGDYSLGSTSTYIKGWGLEVDTIRIDILSDLCDLAYYPDVSWWGICLVFKR